MPGVVSFSPAKVVNTFVISGKPGDSKISIQVIGLHLGGATDGYIQFGNSLYDFDPNMVLTNVVVNADGTVLTADVLISPNAIYGPRSVWISTPAGSSEAGFGSEFIAGYPQLQIQSVSDRIALSNDTKAYAIAAPW